MVKQSILEKVKKALILAEGTKNADEAEAALLAAQRLMAKYNISEKDIERLPEDKKEVSQTDATDLARLQWWEKSLAAIIADNFRCYTFIRLSGRKSKIVFLGLKEDTQIACEVYNFARGALKYYADRYIKTNRLGGDAHRTRMIKNDYMLGFLAGLEQKLKEQVEREKWGLVLVKDEAVVQAFESMKLGKGRAAKVNIGGDEAARSQGFADGHSLDHSRKSLQETNNRGL